MFDDVSQLLTAADVHVSPAPDGSLQPVLEAMAAGIPTVAADVPLNRWLLANPPAGRLVPLEDAGALAAAIMDLLRDAEEAQRLGAAGRERVRREFALAGMVDGFCEVLDRVRGSSYTVRGGK
jgi:glycosyltransferase involved in cell wall biosynthesis